MRQPSVVVLLSVILVIGAGASAQPIAPGDALMSYEGDAEINGYQHDVGNDGSPWVQDIYDTNCTWSASGGVATVQLTSPFIGSDGAVMRVPFFASDGSDGLEHTIDVRAGRPNASWFNAGGNAGGPGFTIAVPTSSSARKLYYLYLGEAGNGADPANTDRLTIWVRSGAKGSDPAVYEIDGIAGLDVGEMNLYRMTMNASGDLRIYVNETEVYSEDGVATYNDDGAKSDLGLISPRSADGSGEQPPIDTNWQLDMGYVRMVRTPMFTPPIPEPATMALLALGAGLSVIRRKK